VERRIPGFPIVLHGASSVAGPQKTINKFGGKMEDAVGIPETQLRKAATSAVCKINIDSDGRLAMTPPSAKCLSIVGRFAPNTWVRHRPAEGALQAQDRNVLGA
jgi:fructose-bisphosphate aldolase class II